MSQMLFAKNGKVCAVVEYAEITLEDLEEGITSCNERLANVQHELDELLKTKERYLKLADSLNQPTEPTPPAPAQPVNDVAPPAATPASEIPAAQPTQDGSPLSSIIPD